MDVDSYATILRKKLVIPSEKKLLIAKLIGSDQEKDIRVPVNCMGYGRIRHFRINKYSDWSPDPLPNLPAAKALKKTPAKTLLTQVFQIAACNWNCWYCFVDNNLRSANPQYSRYFNADELIEMWLKSRERPEVIDLSGGQPDLVPEWVLWIMEAIKKRGLNNKVFLWSDDNLSLRYFWKYLTQKQREYMISFPNYSRVGCFKGFDEDSFSFNTYAPPNLFDRQFEIFRDLLREGFDMYAYVTFTSLPNRKLKHSIKQFMDKLQLIHSNLPLRTVPLKIESYSPTQKNIMSIHQIALKFQYNVHEAWLEEMDKRFSKSERSMPICDISMSL